MIHSLNLETFHLINGYANQSKLLSVAAIVVAKYLILIVPIYLIWMFLKKDNYFKHQSLFAFYSGIVGLFLNFAITFFYFHPRPFMINEGRVLMKHASETSFPSDHTTLLLSIGFYLLFESKLRVYGIFFSIIGFFVGIARIYCGIHWPYDIIGSFCVAFVSALIIFFASRYLYKFNEYIISVYKKLLSIL